MLGSGEIVWHVLTHEHREHSTDWYWALGLLTILGAAASIYFGNFLLGIIVLLGGVSIAILKIRGPREHQVKLDSRGATLDGTLYQWKNIQSFWIHSDEFRPTPRLYITTRSVLMPRIILPLNDETHSEQVYAFCIQYATEAEEEERKPFLTEYVAEIIGL